MRCHITECNDGAITPSRNIWTSGSLPTPNVLKTIIVSDNTDYNPTDDLYKFDSSTSSQKRKLLEGEQEDFEEQFYKNQRKKQLQKVAARANLVVEDDDDDSESDEERIYQQMDWIEKQNGLISYDTSSDEEEDSFFDDKDGSPLFGPHLKWKEDRHRLLRISMAKMNDVEDPESYLWRSVLINNTVRRLQGNDTAIYQCDSLSTYFQRNDFQNDSLSNSDAIVEKLKTDSEVGALSYYEGLPNNNNDPMICPVGLNEARSSFDFPIASTSLPSAKPIFNAAQTLQKSSAFYDRNVLGEQALDDASLTLIPKPQSSLHTFSSQSCGLQYRNPIHSTEENRIEYGESNSSILDSVVYHSLMASIET